MASKKISGAKLTQELQAAFARGRKSQYAAAKAVAANPSTPTCITPSMLQKIYLLVQENPRLTYAEARAKVLAEAGIVHSTHKVPKMPTRTATATDGTLGTPISNREQTITRSTPSGTTVIPSYEAQDAYPLGYETDLADRKTYAKASPGSGAFVDGVPYAQYQKARTSKKYSKGANINAAGQVLPQGWHEKGFVLSSRLESDYGYGAQNKARITHPERYQRPDPIEEDRAIRRYALANRMTYHQARQVLLGDE